METDEHVANKASDTRRHVWVSSGMERYWATPGPARTGFIRPFNDMFCCCSNLELLAAGRDRLSTAPSGHPALLVYGFLGCRPQQMQSRRIVTNTHTVPMTKENCSESLTQLVPSCLFPLCAGLHWASRSKPAALLAGCSALLARAVDFQTGPSVVR